MSNERTPLISPDDDSQSNVVVVEPEQVPSAYENLPPIDQPGRTHIGSLPLVTCRVCHANINIENRMHQHVVKCAQCCEATPIRAPPAGKKYVRCPCHCLLICKAASNRIACPRPNCKRVITLGGSSVGTAIRAPPGTCRVCCAHCREVFMFNTLNNSLARCPHCRKVSSVGQHFARSRGLIFIILGLIFAAIGAGVVAGTWRIVHSQPGVYVVWGGVFVLSLIFFARAIYYLVMRVSEVEGPL